VYIYAFLYSLQPCHQCMYRNCAVCHLFCYVDDEDVDVVSIGDEFQELYGVSTMAELVQHINSMHSYHTRHFMSCHSSSIENASPRQSASKFSINLSMPAKSHSACWSNSMAIGGRHRFCTEQRTKREALNDLERRRRYALARELSALRGVIPDMKEGFRAPKVVILAAAENHIRLLERRLRRDQSILKAEHERCLNLKKRLQALAVDLTT